MLLLVGAAAVPAAAAEPAPTLSVVSFGDSITRGASSCGTRADCPVNSWSTGTASAVRSIATRLQEVNPGSVVTTANYAKSGSRINAVASTVTAAASAGADPDVITLLVGGNDLCHPDLTGAADGYAMTPAASFSASASSLLRQIGSTWPERPSSSARCRTSPPSGRACAGDRPRRAGRRTGSAARPAGRRPTTSSRPATPTPRRSPQLRSAPGSSTTPSPRPAPPSAPAASGTTAPSPPPPSRPTSCPPSTTSTPTPAARP
ncbi:hypothetical protein GSU69_10605 [Rathayibacter festucae]|uniref:SGNH hydrolase-type esterase domain-containing protein n=1 Tax=Rathayibacter festucae TaxID=110937 RepID=A0ABX6H089_9MICO|nr:hypothetical protein GSU69_10605 [Rathayibacter festucae]